MNAIGAVQNVDILATYGNEKESIGPRKQPCVADFQPSPGVHFGASVCSRVFIPD